MRQTPFAGVGFERFGKTTRRAANLAEMDQIVPWKDLCHLIEPLYPKPGYGRPPVGLERVLRIYSLQQWFNLSDDAVKKALYESLSMRGFAGIDLGREPVPDDTTVCKFRHLLERHGLGRALFERMHAHLDACGVVLSKDTIVDATIIHAPSSTKNASGTRDPDMHQTRKGQQWYFGIKAHIGVDIKTELFHAVVATAANVHDAMILLDLLRGDETRVRGDQAYRGRTGVIRKRAPNANDFTNRCCRSRGLIYEAENARNRTKSKIRAKVERCFGVMKQVFGFTKVRCRGLEKNVHRLFVTCGWSIYL